MGKIAFMEMVDVFMVATPDLKSTLSDFQVSGNIVRVSDKGEGTHTGTFDGTSMGMPILPPTGNIVRTPLEQYEFTIVNGKIVQQRDVTTPTGEAGFDGFLKAMGVTLPAD